MKRSRWLLLGIFLTLAFSWFGLAMAPQLQVGKLGPVTDEEMTDVYPINAGGIVAQGQAVYAANGCVYCHSQQVRDTKADLDRGWGTRRTVARDYIYDSPAFLGTMRNGPDLANIGSPQRVKDAAWHYMHLYDPRITNPDSIMPPFRYLFVKHKVSGQPSAEALGLPGRDAPPEGYEIIPSAEARSLVGYLLSLNRTHPLKEAAPEAEVAK